MEKKLNIAEILKDKPQGTKLYDWLYNVEVELDTISNTDTETVVWCTNKTDNNTTCHRGYSEFGTVRGCPDGLQILLPSKEMRDWRKFDWKKGDVLESDNKLKRCIFEEWANDDYTDFNCFAMDEGWNDYFSKINNSTCEYHKADDYVTELHIKRVEKKFGGKLNLETLEIEQPKQEFKDGDILAQPSSSVIGKNYIFILKEFNEHKNFKYYVALTGFGKLDFDFPKYGNIWNYKDKNIHYATEEEKQQLFEALAKEGKAWDAEKKAIVDLKTKVELKPFDKVLVRDRKTYHWEVDLFGFKTEGPNIVYHCVGGSWKFCIPYIGNESLLGTIKDAEK